MPRWATTFGYGSDCTAPGAVSNKREERVKKPR